MSDRRGEKLLTEISGKLDALSRRVHGGGGGAGAGSGGGAGPGKPSSGTVTAGFDLEALRMTTRLQTVIDPKELLDSILDAMIYVSKADRGFLMLIEEGRKLRFKVGRSFDQKDLQKESQHSRSIIKQVITTGQPVLIQGEGDLSTASMGRLNLRSVICVPLAMRSRRLAGDDLPRDGQVGGVVYLDSKALGHPLGQPELELVMTLAEQAAVALENKKLFDQAQADRAHLAVDEAKILKLRENITRLLSVGRAISSTLVMDELFVMIMDKVIELTKADRGYMMLLGDDGELVFKIGRARDDDGLMADLTETSFFFSRTITKRALTENRSICLTDAMGSDQQEASMSIMQMELQSVMCTPLREKGKTLGLVYVDSKASIREFEDADVELFEALAGQAAIALRNAMLYEEAKEQERLKSELQIASKIQTDILPKAVPLVEGIELFGYFEAAKEVSGDYYDFMPDPASPDKAITICIGDVSGKGVPAGLVMVMARCFLKSLVSHYGPTQPREVISHLNSILCSELEPGMFMTMLLIGWDANTGTLRYSAAGHEHILIRRGATGKVEARKSGGAPLGISEASDRLYVDNELDLQPGDVAVLYTDGVTEAMNDKQDEWGMDAFIASVERHGEKTAKELADAVLADVAAHRGSAEVSDDITMVVVKRK